MGNLGRSFNESAGCVLFIDPCQILASGTHDLTTDFLPEDEFGFTETDLCGKKAAGDMFVVDHPDDYVTRAAPYSVRSEDIEGGIFPW